MAIARADAATLLARALRLSATPHGIAIDRIAVTDRPWASATFDGIRHRVELTLHGAGHGAGARGWLATLAEAELPMRGHVVVDLSVDTVADGTDGVVATLTALTLAEG